MVLIITSAGLGFAIGLNELRSSLNEGVSASEEAVNITRSIRNREDAEEQISSLVSLLNIAENALLDSINYADTHDGSLPGMDEPKVNQIKANIRQVINKMEAFGFSVSISGLD